LKTKWTKKIPNYSDYEISIFGSVISYKRYKGGVFLKPHIDKDGYKIVVLTTDGVGKKFKVHRLVALTFIPNPKNLPQVNHKDGNKRNNHFRNLEWSTNTHNQQHAWDTELKFKKLTIAEVKTIKQKINKGISNTKIAKEYGVNQSTISNIKTNTTWKRI
jgi:hypothetical protein